MESEKLNPTKLTISFEETDSSVGYGVNCFITYRQTSAVIVPASKSAATFCSQGHGHKLQQFAMSSHSYKNPSTHTHTTPQAEYLSDSSLATEYGISDLMIF